MNSFDANGLQAYANDAAFEAVQDPFEGAIYWNTTEKCVRQFNGAYPTPGLWQYDKTIFTTQTDSTTTGSAQDITPNTVAQIIRFTQGSLISIRGITPSNQKVITIVNGQASQAIMILNEDLTATAANRIVTGTGSDFSLAASQTIQLIYETGSSRWRFSAVPAGAGSQLSDWSTLINNLSISATVAANALTVALKTKAGTDATALSPILISFRNSTNSTGTYNVRSLSSANSMVVSSGSTLGHANAVAYPIFVYALDNSGTIELAVSTTLFDTSAVAVSTTAEGGAGAADSIGIIYSTTARANIPFRLIGKIVSTQATAGTWASTPTTVTTTMLDSPASSLAGITSGVAIAAGYVGQVVSIMNQTATTYSATATGAGTAITTVGGVGILQTTSTNPITILLTPGIWIIRGQVEITQTSKVSTSTGLSLLQIGLSSNSTATSPTSGFERNSCRVLTGDSVAGMNMNMNSGATVNISVNTNYYFTYLSQGSGATLSITNACLEATRIA
jgi:hypothetical protein